MDKCIFIQETNLKLKMKIRENSKLNLEGYQSGWEKSNADQQGSE